MAGTMTRIADHLNWHFKQWLLARRARSVLDTPPLTPRDDGVVLFSMIGTRVLLPYLVAVKSLHRNLGRGRIALLDDGTLTANDHALLVQHLGDPEIRHIDDVDTGPCPRGGTWERLLTILDLRRDSYVIQLDSDTVTLGALPEVAGAIHAGRSFTLRGEEDARLLDTHSFAEQYPPIDPWDSTVHVQGAIEVLMDRVEIPERPELRYARGCSGFAGFAPSAEGRALAEAFSREGARLLSMPRWASWGSEQVTSNFVIANEADPLLLPYGRYRNFWNDGICEDARLVHFIGTYRFHGTAYLDAVEAAVRDLSAARDGTVARRAA